MCIWRFWLSISSGIESRNIELNSWDTLYEIVPKVQYAYILPTQLWTTHTIWPQCCKQFCLACGDESSGLKICDAGSWIHMWQVSAWNKCCHCCKHRWPCCGIVFENFTVTAGVRTWLVYWNCTIIRTVFWWHWINEWNQTGVTSGYTTLGWHGTINWWVNTFSIACSVSYTSKECKCGVLWRHSLVWTVWHLNY